MMIRPSAVHGKEPTFSMGDDTPIAALSRHERSIFNHLRQRFAQVTNPAMDHLRERSVMSLAVLLGPRAPLLRDAPGAAALEELESFFQLGAAVGPAAGRHVACTTRPRRAARCAPAARVRGGGGRGRRRARPGGERLRRPDPTEPRSRRSSPWAR